MRKPAKDRADKKEVISRSAFGTLFLLSCLGLVVMFDETMILPAIPDLIRDFGISYSTSSWLLSAYIIAAAVMTPIAGKLSDVYGRKRVLLIIMAVYIVGVAAGRFATGIETMVAARLAQGVGLAMFPIAFGVVRECLPMSKLGLGQTVFSAMFPAGAVIGLIGGAAIISGFGWQATFLAILPVSMALWLGILRFMPPDNVPKKKKGSSGSSIDFKGIFSLTATVVFFLTGLTLLENRDDSYLISGLFAAAVASLAIFVFVERRAKSPLMDLGLMRSMSFLPPTVILLLVFLSMFMVYLTVPVMVRSPAPLGFGGDAFDIANVQAPFMAVFLIGTIGSGFLLNRIRSTKLLLIGGTVSTAGFLLLLFSHSTPEMVSVGLTVMAAGLSLSMTGGFNVVLSSVPPQVTGTALGMVMLLNLVGMSVGPALAGTLQQLSQESVPGVEGTFPSAEAYMAIFAVAAAMSIISLILAFILSRSKISGAPSH